MQDLPSTSTAALTTTPPVEPPVRASDIVEWGVLAIGTVSGVAMAALTAVVGAHVGGPVGLLTFLAGVGLGAPVSLFCGGLLGQAMRTAAARATLQLRVIASPAVVPRGSAVIVVVTSARPLVTITVRLVRSHLGMREVVAVAGVGAELRVPEDATPTSRGIAWLIEIEGEARRLGSVTAEAPLDVVA